MGPMIGFWICMAIVFVPLIAIIVLVHLEKPSKSE